jgi:hypothetical protein
MKHRITDPELRACLTAIGIDPDEDFSDIEAPEDISAIPKDKWEDCTRVIPPPAILRYLASGDTLSNQTIDIMEEAMETAFGVQSPWYITSIRNGSEDDENLSVAHFSLRREAGSQL